ncbi:MAG: hypothetical protein G01um101430_173 [Parcubacteria group bacterium Gr01-1014_30]|nr:MAG: hypothetical protein G01um101430_173 [Parcubacteria group bacterium Gr01-1014_30]
MRRLAIVVLVLVSVATAVAAQEITGEFVVTGYLPGEFAVRGEVERQLNQLVAEIKKRLENGQLQISVIGSADVTGSSPINDRLAQDRAGQVAAVLTANFPEARIVAWSRGDAENIRQVRVEYRIIPPQEEAEGVSVAKEPSASPKAIMLVGAVVLLAVVLAILLSRNMLYMLLRGRVTAQPAQGPRWVDVEVGGVSYSVKIAVFDGVFVSPFRTRNGFTISRKNFSGIKSSLAGCLEGEEFASQKRDLIAEGKIIVKQAVKTA